jgi:hypothetical protein
MTPTEIQQSVAGAPAAPKSRDTRVDLHIRMLDGSLRVASVTVHVPTPEEERRMGLTRASLADGVPWVNLDGKTQYLILAQVHVFGTLRDVPKWLETAISEDSDLLTRLDNELYEFDARYYTRKPIDEGGDPAEVVRMFVDGKPLHPRAPRKQQPASPQPPRWPAGVQGAQGSPAGMFAPEDSQPTLGDGGAEDINFDNPDWEAIRAKNATIPEPTGPLAPIDQAAEMAALMRG